MLSTIISVYLVDTLQTAGFGTYAMTYIVMVFCVLAILACNLLPKEYDELDKK